RRDRDRPRALDRGRRRLVERPRRGSLRERTRAARIRGLSRACRRLSGRDMIRLGINPISWTNDDLPELGDDISLDTCLEEARAAGFAGVELGRKFPRDAAQLGPILDARGLRLVSGWYSLRL